jgi:ABC-type Na+ efflux pump permease subunit
MGSGSVTRLDQQQYEASLQQVRKQYCSLALAIAICAGALLIFSGYRALGKGLILGSVFSVLNFILMAAFLPLLAGQTRKSASLISLSSILFRFALLAVPLIGSLHSEQFAVSTAAAGLFMVQVAILGDQLWRRLRNQEEVRY